MRLLTTSLIAALLLFGSPVIAQDLPGTGPSIPPPAGRALLSRSANLEAYDFPASARSDFDTRLHEHPTLPVLGPPDFWTESSLRAHYQDTLRYRYHPQLFRVPPPFEVWLKEQKLIRAIAMLSSMIRIETTRENVSRDALLHHEMHLGELSALLRQLQIATSLEYATLPPEWRKFEEFMYRHWGAFLAVSQGERNEAYSLEYWKQHLAYVEELAREIAEEEEQERLEREAAAAKENERKGRWREIKIERGDLVSTTPRRWLHTPDIGTSSGEEVTKGLREAFGKGFHL